eukprot:CAMPEP_0116927572 /NCGR_PEP_ID=MMETSP0467-20121206/25442_1 /TAXON_ID=283647 /ORGANISM="Mesodinium pulex, Strain SPMC105" /LENGTH=73 /DNA_ID=CAMNT_0004607129 /DNA_START=526 /DNA_END=747 /DNA_ORIENTATION=+
MTSVGSKATENSWAFRTMSRDDRERVLSSKKDFMEKLDYNPKFDQVEHRVKSQDFNKVISRQESSYFINCAEK